MATLAAEVAAEAGTKSIGSILKVALPIAALLGVIIYIAILRGDIRHLTKENTRLTRWQSDTVAAVTSEVPLAHRRFVTADTASDEIHWLGRELRTANQALADQTAAVQVAERKANDDRNAYQEALGAAQEREKANEATRVALRDPKRSTGLSAAEWDRL